MNSGDEDESQESFTPSPVSSSANSSGTAPSSPPEKESNEFQSMSDKKRMARLQFLIEQSQVYTNILSERLAQQQAQIRSRQKAEAKKEAKEQTAENDTGRTMRSGKTTSTVSHKPTTRRSKRTASAQDESKLQGSMLDFIKAKKAKVEHHGDEGKPEEAAKSDKKEHPLLKPTSKFAGNQPKLVTGCVMRDYQLAGVEWLASLYENGLNGILADEMGLGKTIQAIGFIAYLLERGVNGPFLIVGPLSTIANWQEEFTRRAPSIRTLLYHGNPVERQDLRHKYFTKKANHNVPVIITSYEMIMIDRKYLQRIHWKYLIIDEGHRLKNLNSKLIKELKTYHTANRLLLTGTPLQNSLAELWTLLNFLLPDIFSDLNLFQSWFDFSDIGSKKGDQTIIDKETSDRIISKLHAILKPFLLRRVKADVEAGLPDKREYVIYAPLTPLQQQLYKAVLDGTLQDLLVEKILEARNISGAISKEEAEKGESERSASASASGRRSRSQARVDYDESESQDEKYFKDILEDEASNKTSGKETPGAKQTEIENLVKDRHIRDMIHWAKREASGKKLQNKVMQLRLVCNSPYLFYFPWKDDEPVDDRLVNNSGKMLLLQRLVPELVRQGHKILIFSQFTSMLDLLAEWAVTLHGWGICRIDGSVPQEVRQEEIDSFSTDTNKKVFLLTTRAGGLGINLTAADTVILFDSDWNPQQDLQAMDRVHRIGQTKPVLVYRLATSNTVEQIILMKANAKRRLEKLVIQRGKFISLASGGKDSDKRGASGSTTPKENDRKQELQDLEQLLKEQDTEKFTIKGKGDSILSDQELRELTDRSPKAYEKAKKDQASHSETFSLIEPKLPGDAESAMKD